MPRERRQTDRLPVSLYLQQIIDDEPFRCFTSNLSPTGLYMERICSPLDRRSSVVQIELPLPGTSDSLWAKAEIVYDCFDALFHGTAVRFTAMARQHRRILEGWLDEVSRGFVGTPSAKMRQPDSNLFRPRPRFVI